MMSLILGFGCGVGFVYLLKVLKSKKNKDFKNDLVIVNTSRSCPVCGKYDKKIYSISGKSTTYPKLPTEISRKGGFCPKCSLSLCSYFEGISTKP